MRPFDDHISSGRNKDARGHLRVCFEEPDSDRDVVGDAMVRHGDGAVSLQEMNGATIVANESGRFDGKAGEIVD